MFQNISKERYKYSLIKSFSLKYLNTLIHLKMIFLLIVALAILTNSSTASTLHTSDPDEQQRLFNGFKTQYRKSYDTNEEPAKLKAFVANLLLADARNEEERKRGGSAVHGITQFSDLTQEEFKTTYLKVKRPTAIAEKKVARMTSTQNNMLPQALVDWTGNRLYALTLT